MHTPLSRNDNRHTPFRPAGFNGGGSISRLLTSGEGEPVADDLPPVLGFILIGGALVGAQVRDIRLANELSARGYPVHVWWAADKAKNSGLSPAIQQHWLFHVSRYAGHFEKNLEELTGRLITWSTSDATRAQFSQSSPRLLKRLMNGLVREVCIGVEHDQPLIRRFAKELTASKVTHLMPTLECLAPYAVAARKLVPHPLRYLVTFQGYELYANYAREMGLEATLYHRLAEAVAQSNWPAVAVSDAYAERVCEDIDLHDSLVRPIPPGIPTPEPMELSRARELVRQGFPGYQPNLPTVAFLGRRDSEKGIDLLLYATQILRRSGYEFQLAICGPTAFGASYEIACRQIGENLRCPVLWSGYVSDELRSALFRASRCVVYPSIHAEPFGMVPVEAMAHGTPVVVPDTGGVAGVTRFESLQAGLIFRSWDSGHLAEQIGRLLDDVKLHAQLSQDAPQIAAQYSVQKMGDRVLDHVRLPRFNRPALEGNSHLPSPKRALVGTV